MYDFPYKPGISYSPGVNISSSLSLRLWNIVDIFFVENCFDVVLYYITLDIRSVTHCMYSNITMPLMLFLLFVSVIVINTGQQQVPLICSWLQHITS